MSVRILTGSCLDLLASLDAGSVQTCVTSPPYWGLRDYGHAGQLGLEATPEEYVARMVEVFRAVKRVLRDDGTLWLNLGDSYSGGGRGGNPGDSPFQKQATNAGSLSVRGVMRDGLKPKDLVGIPWRVAFALQADGWYLRSDIIWHKPNPMPESVTDRPTKAHEYVFLLAKQERYVYDAEAIAEAGAPSSQARAGIPRKVSPKDRIRAAGMNGGSRSEAGVIVGEYGGTRNARSVWPIATQPYKGAHFATMPPALAERCILAGSRPGDVVLDPFGGAGTTGLVADRLGRGAILCELNPEYATLAAARIRGDSPLLSSVEHVA